MANKGRKPKKQQGYFYNTEEEAIIQYISATSISEKNRIFNTHLYPAFTKMIESIIRTYKLFVPDEEFDVNFSDTISYLLTKINLYRSEIMSYDEIEKEEAIKNGCVSVGLDFLKEKARNATDDDPQYIKVVEIINNGEDTGEEEYIETYYKRELHHYKAYSYCGTICKNYLRFKCMQYAKKRQKNTPYDEVFEEINNSEQYSTENGENKNIAENIVKDIVAEITRMTNDSEKYNLSEDEIKVGKAIVNLLENWEEVLPDAIDGKCSTKLQKSSVLYFLREETMMTTHEIRKNMAKYKTAYNVVKKLALE